MRLSSPAFADGSPIPVRHTGDGEDISPPLEWSDAPPGTRDFALLCEDPDAPTPQPWVHWVVYGIPGDTQSLAEGASHTPRLAGKEGRNSWKSGQTIGYRGPAPPPGHGVHRYYFRLYALDAPLPRPQRIDKDAVLQALRGHVLATAELMGTYERV